MKVSCYLKNGASNPFIPSTNTLDLFEGGPRDTRIPMNFHRSNPLALYGIWHSSVVSLQGSGGKVSKGKKSLAAYLQGLQWMTERMIERRNTRTEYTKKNGIW